MQKAKDLISYEQAELKSLHIAPANLLGKRDAGGKLTRAEVQTLEAYACLAEELKKKPEERIPEKFTEVYENDFPADEVDVDRSNDMGRERDSTFRVAASKKNTITTKKKKKHAVKNKKEEPKPPVESTPIAMPIEFIGDAELSDDEGGNEDGVHARHAEDEKVRKHEKREAASKDRPYVGKAGKLKKSQAGVLEEAFNTQGTKLRQPGEDLNINPEKKGNQENNRPRKRGLARSESNNEGNNERPKKRPEAITRLGCHSERMEKANDTNAKSKRIDVASECLGLDVGRNRLGSTSESLSSSGCTGFKRSDSTISDGWNRKKRKVVRAEAQTLEAYARLAKDLKRKPEERIPEKFTDVYENDFPADEVDVDESNDMGRESDSTFRVAASKTNTITTKKKKKHAVKNKKEEPKPPVVSTPVATPISMEIDDFVGDAELSDDEGGNEDGVHSGHAENKKVRKHEKREAASKDRPYVGKAGKLKKSQAGVPEEAFKTSGTKLRQPGEDFNINPEKKGNQENDRPSKRGLARSESNNEANNERPKKRPEAIIRLGCHSEMMEKADDTNAKSKRIDVASECLGLDVGRNRLGGTSESLSSSGCTGFKRSDSTISDGWNIKKRKVVRAEAQTLEAYARLAKDLKRKPEERIPEKFTDVYENDFPADEVDDNESNDMGRERDSTFRVAASKKNTITTKKKKKHAVTNKKEEPKPPVVSTPVATPISMEIDDFVGDAELSDDEGGNEDGVHSGHAENKKVRKHEQREAASKDRPYVGKAGKLKKSQAGVLEEAFNTQGTKLRQPGEDFNINPEKKGNQENDRPSKRGLARSESNNEGNNKRPKKRPEAIIGLGCHSERMEKANDTNSKSKRIDGARGCLVLDMGRNRLGGTSEPGCKGFKRSDSKMFDGLKGKMGKVGHIAMSIGPPKKGLFKEAEVLPKCHGSDCPDERSVYCLDKERDCPDLGLNGSKKGVECFPKERKHSGAAGPPEAKSCKCSGSSKSRKRLKVSKSERKDMDGYSKVEVLSHVSGVYKRIKEDHKKLWGQIMFSNREKDWKGKQYAWGHTMRPVLVLGPHQIPPDRRNRWATMVEKVSNMYGLLPPVCTVVVI